MADRYPDLNKTLNARVGALIIRFTPIQVNNGDDPMHECGRCASTVRKSQIAKHTQWHEEQYHE